MLPKILYVPRSFVEAYEELKEAFSKHYETGEYAPLGMVLQEHERTVLMALKEAGNITDD